MAPLRTNLVLGLILSLATAIAADHCYFPSGDSVSGGSWTACKSNYDGDAGATPCCSQGDTCLSSGFCQQPGNKVVYRGACSESSWGDDVGCPTHCRDVNASSTATVQQCSNSQYCCQTSGDCCKDASALFSANAATTGSTPPQRSSSGSGSDSSYDHPSTLTTAVGAGVGGGVTILAAVIIIAWYRARRSRQHHEKNVSLRSTPSDAEVGGAAAAVPGEAPPPYESQKPEALPSLYTPDRQHPSDKGKDKVGQAL